MAAFVVYSENENSLTGHGYWCEGRGWVKRRRRQLSSFARSPHFSLPYSVGNDARWLVCTGSSLRQSLGLKLDAAVLSRMTLPKQPITRLAATVEGQQCPSTSINPLGRPVGAHDVCKVHMEVENLNRLFKSARLVKANGYPRCHTH